MPLVAGPVFDAGSPVSHVFAIGNTAPFFLVTPQEWTPANLTFLVSGEGDNFFPIYKGGKLWELACPPNAAVLLETTDWPKSLYMRFVSGTVEAPVNQEAGCQFKLITGVGGVVSVASSNKPRTKPPAPKSPPTRRTR